MTTKNKRAKRSKKLLLRAKLARREKAARRGAAERITFTKRSVGAIAHPPTGERAIYRDSRTPHLCLRVTPTAKTFYWEKTVLGRQKRVTIGRFPAINVEQARAVAADIAADYVKGVQQNRRARREEATFGELWADYREDRPKLLFLSVLYTGRRRRELQKTIWGKVDLESGIWKLPKTKSGEPQEAMIPTKLIELLAEHKTRVKSGRDDPVFPSPSKSGHIEEVKKAWARVRKVSGLHDLQARDLRRTLASWAQDEKVPIAVMSSQLGHADIATTHKHYTNIDPTVQRLALDAIVASIIKAAESSGKSTDQEP